MKKTPKLLVGIVLVVVGLGALAVSYGYTPQEIAESPAEEKPVNESTSIEDIIKNTGDASVQATEDASDPCLASPNVQMFPTSVETAAGATIKYWVGITSSETAGCPDRNISLSASGPSGWTITLSPSKIAMQWGDSKSAQLKVVSNTTAQPGNYTITVLVENIDTGKSGSNETVFIIKSPTSSEASTSVSGNS